MDERMRRLWAAAEARTLGRGGITAVAEATGMSRVTVSAGVRELQGAETTGVPVMPLIRQADERVRRAGAGRKPLTAVEPDLLKRLEFIVSPYTRGDPRNPLRWTCKGVRRLA